MTKNTISEALSRFVSLPLLFWSDFLDWIRFGKILTEQFLAKTLRPQSVHKYHKVYAKTAKCTPKPVGRLQGATM